MGPHRGVHIQYAVNIEDYFYFGLGLCHTHDEVGAQFKPEFRRRIDVFLRDIADIIDTVDDHAEMARTAGLDDDDAGSFIIFDRISVEPIAQIHNWHNWSCRGLVPLL